MSMFDWLAPQWAVTENPSITVIDTPKGAVTDEEVLRNFDEMRTRLISIV